MNGQENRAKGTSKGTKGNTMRYIRKLKDEVVIQTIDPHITIETGDNHTSVWYQNGKDRRAILDFYIAGKHNKEGLPDNPTLTLTDGIKARSIGIIKTHAYFKEMQPLKGEGVLYELIKQSKRVI